MLNLILGAAEDAERGGEGLGAATTWAAKQGVASYVPVTPGLPGASTAEAWLQGHSFERDYSWMKFVRDPHPPRFPAPDGVEVVELSAPDQEPFGMIAATGFGMYPWAADFFA